MNLQKHLRELSMSQGLPKDHISYLHELKRGGFDPAVIYDIGSCVLHWTNVAQSIWPNAHIILFDAFAPAQFLYTKHDHFIGVLSDVDGKMVRFYQNDRMPGGNSYYREVGCPSGDFFPVNNYIEKTTRSLDSIVREMNFPPPDLVKVDVQGAEADVIKGGNSTILHAEKLIVEMQHTEYNSGAPLVYETLPFIEALGFKCTHPKFCNNGFDADYGFSRRLT